MHFRDKPIKLRVGGMRTKNHHLSMHLSILDDEDAAEEDTDTTVHAWSEDFILDDAKGTMSGEAEASPPAKDNQAAETEAEAEAEAEAEPVAAEVNMPEKDQDQHMDTAEEEMPKQDHAVEKGGIPEPEEEALPPSPESKMATEMTKLDLSEMNTSQVYHDVAIGLLRKTVPRSEKGIKKEFPLLSKPEIKEIVKNLRLDKVLKNGRQGGGLVMCAKPRDQESLEAYFVSLWNARGTAQDPHSPPEEDAEIATESPTPSQSRQPRKTPKPSRSNSRTATPLPADDSDMAAAAVSSSPETGQSPGDFESQSNLPSPEKPKSNRKNETTKKRSRRGDGTFCVCFFFFVLFDLYLTSRPFAC